MIHLCFLGVLPWLQFYSPRRAQSRLIFQVLPGAREPVVPLWEARVFRTFSRFPAELGGGQRRHNRHEGKLLPPAAIPRGNYGPKNLNFFQILFGSPIKSSQADAQGPRRTPYAHRGRETDPRWAGRRWAAGRPAVRPRRPATRSRPADVRAGCRAPSGDRFCVVSSLRSPGETRRGEARPRCPKGPGGCPVPAVPGCPRLVHAPEAGRAWLCTAPRRPTALAADLDAVPTQRRPGRTGSPEWRPARGWEALPGDWPCNSVRRARHPSSARLTGAAFASRPTQEGLLRPRGASHGPSWDFQSRPGDKEPPLRTRLAREDARSMKRNRRWTS